MTVKFAKLIIVLAMCVASSVGRRRPHHGGMNTPCEDCFAPDKCLGGVSETLGDDCSTCLREQCEDEFTVGEFHGGRWSNAFGIECISEAWQGNCSSDCPEWNSNRVRGCENCVANCLRKVSSSDVCPNGVTSNWDACSSCFGESSCFNSSELTSLLSDFCFGYVNLACRDNSSDDCILDAIRSPCSQCDLNNEELDRLETCSFCLSDCKTEGVCINDCRKATNYPEEVPCGYCSLFCRLEGRIRKPRHYQFGGSMTDSETSACQFNDTVCPACGNCDTCVEQCKDDTSGEFNFSNLCTCIQGRSYEMEKIALRNLIAHQRWAYRWN